MPLIADAVAGVLARPGPVIFLDTCNLLDLIRAPQRQGASEVLAAVTLTNELRRTPPALWVVVGELVPLEWLANVGPVEQELLEHLELVDRQLAEIAAVSAHLGTSLPAPSAYARSSLPGQLRGLAQALLDAAVPLDRDWACVDRALTRLVQKRRPSHHKEIKDSINLEQYLEMTRQLRAGGFGMRCALVSSNTADFGIRGASTVHPDLAGEFAPVNLDYYPSLSAALGQFGFRPAGPAHP